MFDTYKRFFDHLINTKSWVDLGCNCGFFSLGLQSAINRSHSDKITTTALLVDPNKHCIQNVHDLINANDFNWFYHQGLIGDGSNTVYFYENTSSIHSSIFEKPKRYKRRQFLPLNIKDLAINCGLDTAQLLKVDIEGAEKYLFRDYSNWLRSFQHVLMEWHEPQWSGQDMENFIKKTRGKVIEVCGLFSGKRDFSDTVGMVLWENAV